MLCQLIYTTRCHNAVLKCHVMEQRRREFRLKCYTNSKSYRFSYFFEIFGKKLGTLNQCMARQQTVQAGRGVQFFSGETEEDKNQ